MLPVPLENRWTFFGADFGAAGAHTTGKSFLLAGALYNCLGDQRESLPGLMTSGLRIGDDAACDRKPNWRRAVPFVLYLFLAVGVAYVVAGTRMPYNGYTYAVTLDKTQTAPVNWYAMTDAVTANILGPASQYRPPDCGPGRVPPWRASVLIPRVDPASWRPRRTGRRVPPA